MFSSLNFVKAYEVGHKLDGNYTYEKLTCGDQEIPKMAADITRTVVLILQIGTPVIIIILGMVDLFKATMAQKEDDIKKAQQTFLRRLGLGVLVFLVFVIVELVVGLVAPRTENEGMWKCADCFINGNC